MAAQIIMASHIVKPSSPTPLASKTYKLSFLDQIAASYYIPVIFFYKSDLRESEDEKRRRLKQSLSETLSIFYPLGGRVKQNSHVDCDGRGAKLVEARVHAPLSHFTQDPKMEELKQLLPADSGSYIDDDAAELHVKVSFFDCGGMSIGVCFSHKIGDFSSFAMFMNAWAATCRGEGAAVEPPRFDIAHRFPPREELSGDTGSGPGFTKEKIVTRRLVLEREKVEKLRKEAASSRVEAVSAFIWRNVIKAHRSPSPPSSFMLTHAVNLRPRAVPPLSDHSFGNCATPASAVAPPSKEDGALLSELRAALRLVDHYSVAMDGGHIIRSAEKMFGPGNYVISSWWRFPVYEVDFGWGKPAWVCPGTIPYMNVVVLMDTPSSDGGIEAWINMPDDRLLHLLEADYNNI